MRRFHRLLLATPLLVLVQAADAHCWGLTAHQAVAGEAIDSLPKELKGFYKDHRLELPTLSLEPDLPAEGADRRFPVDRFLSFPFSDLPHSEAAFKQRFGEDADKAGRLPWLVLESYARLVEAFRAADKTRILAESDLLAGLVADLNNPLALTDNADGQKTEQHGLWVRFSVKLPESQQNSLKLSAKAARFLDDPKGYLFSIIESTYIWVDNLLYLEALAHRGQSGYTEIYYDFFALHAKDLLQDRLSSAASDAGSFWYTAWTEAGRPKLK